MTVPTEPRQTAGKLIDLILKRLVPMLLDATDGDPHAARALARETVGDYAARNNADLVAIAQIIACGLASLGNLSLSMEAGIPHDLALRLQAAANALDRTAEQNRRVLRKAPPAPTDFCYEPTPEDAALEAEASAAVARARRAVARANAGHAAATAPAPAGAGPGPGPEEEDEAVGAAIEAAVEAAMAEARQHYGKARAEPAATQAPEPAKPDAAAPETAAAPAALPPEATKPAPAPAPAAQSPGATAPPPETAPAAPPPETAPAAPPPETAPAAPPPETAPAAPPPETKASPLPAEATSPAPARTVPDMTDREKALAWANSMARIATEFERSIPHLPPAQRKAASLRAQALSTTASYLIAGAQPDPLLLPKKPRTA